MSVGVVGRRPAGARRPRPGRRRRGRGAVLLPQEAPRQRAKTLRVAIDLNGVPPVGIEGVELTDKGADRDGVVCYGALGVGGTKMKIHKAAVAKLFEANNPVLDIEEIYEIGSRLT